MMSYVLFAFFPMYGLAQSMSDLTQMAEALYSQTDFPRQFVPVIDLTTLVDDFLTAAPESSNARRIDLARLESQEFQKDLGLVFKANTNFNFIDEFDDDTNSFNRFRLRTELEWNLFKGGFIQNRNLSKIKENEARILQLEEIRNQKISLRRQMRIDIAYAINKEKELLLDKFLIFENHYFDLLNSLYQNKLVKREEIIQLANRIAMLENELKLLKKENDLIEPTVRNDFKSSRRLPFLTLKSDSLSLYTTDQLPYLIENMQLERDPINNYNLSFFVSQNLNYFTNRLQLIPTIGARFRIPIRGNRRRSIEETKSKILELDMRDRVIGVYNRLITNQKSYNEKAKDLQNQFHSLEFIDERIRVWRLVKDEVKFEQAGIHVLAMLEEKFEVHKNIIELKRQLYTQLLHLFELHPNGDLYAMVAPLNFDRAVPTKNVLLTVNPSYTLEFQVNYLRSKRNLDLYVKLDDLKVKHYLNKEKISYKTTSESNVPELSDLIDFDIKILKE